MIRRTLCLVAAAGFAAMVACGDGTSDTSLAPAADGGAPSAAPIGEIVSVDAISVYQAVKVSLVEQGEPTKQNAPIIANRPALVRVHASKPMRTSVKKLVAELRVQVPGAEDVVLTTSPRSLAPFIETSLDTTFNFELTAEQVGHDARLSVELRDPTGEDPSVVRYPAEGELPMNVGALEPKLRVRFVPIHYQADGADLSPPLDAATVDDYRTALYKMYPVAEVELSVREQISWPLTVEPTGEGWDKLLDAVIETRKDDKVDADIYYVGVFTPAATEREYCKSGCILGVAPAKNPLVDSGSLRTAMIVGYRSERTHGTLAQELAHSMGRMHAPCGRPAAIDPKYPYDDARIGVGGYDLISKELIDPATSDFMSYCSPVWVSDYTYAGIYDRMVEVARELAPKTRRAVKTYHVAKDGSLTVGPTIEATELKGSETFVVEDDAHSMVTKVRGALLPLSGIGGGLLVAADEIPAASLKRARFARPIQLPESASLR